MKPFQFCLDSLLRLREAGRDARRTELAQSLAEQQHRQALQQALERKLLEAGSQDRLLREASAVSLERLRQASLFRQAITDELERIRIEVATIAAQVDACQRRLAEAECDYQAVCKLREVRLMTHHRDVFREETKLTDEAAGRRFRRAA